MFQKIIFSN